MNADDTDLAYTLEELAAAEQFFGVNLFDLIGQPDPRVEGEVTCTFNDAVKYHGEDLIDLIIESQSGTGVLEEYELPAESIVRSAEMLPEVIEMEADAYYALAWLRNADASGQLNLSGRTVRVAVVV